MELKEKMRALWCEVLENDSIGDDDRIMDIGGNSVMVYKICMLADERYGIKTVPMDIMMYPTLNELCCFLEGGSKKNEAEADTDDIRPSRRRRIKK